MFDIQAVIIAVILAAVGWGLAIYSYLGARKGRILAESFYDALARGLGTIDFGGGRTARFFKTQSGAWQVDASRQLEQKVRLITDVQTKKISGEKEKEG